MIEGVKIVLLQRIPDDRGKILHILKSNEDAYSGFGEVYCSSIFPGVVKGWHWHRDMTLNYVVIAGMIKFVLYDDRKESTTYKQLQEIYLGEDNYVRVTVPPKVWNGFKCVGQNEAYIINVTDIPHDPAEVKRMDPHDNKVIKYDWATKDR